jgi:hypothetical protein
VKIAKHVNRSLDAVPGDSAAVSKKKSSLNACATREPRQPAHRESASRVLEQAAAAADEDVPRKPAG